MLVDTKKVAKALRAKSEELNEISCYHLEHTAIMGGPLDSRLSARADALEDMAIVFESLELEDEQTRKIT